MTSWTAEQVLSLAPDASSAKAGQKQSAPGVWSAVGSSERALWGLCQGSGAKPYQVVVDLPEPAFKCTCPSRKFPCKHALGLMLLHAAAGLPGGEAPDWAASWLASRAERAEKRAAPAAPVDPAKAVEDAAKRVARREERVREGIAELRLWLDDLIRQGLAHAEQRGRREWEQMAARLVDAQAPGLARRVREMASTVGSAPDWPAELLRQAGLLSLLADAYARHGELGDGLGDEIRTQIGWTAQPGAEVRDAWRCVGQVVTEQDDRLRSRRTWLWGAGTGRFALLLDFAHASQPLPPAPATGQTLNGAVAFYPGVTPRAQVVGAGEAAGGGGEAAAGGDEAAAGGDEAAAGGDEAAAGGAGGAAGARGEAGGAGAASRTPPPASVADAYLARARALAANPWTERVPIAVTGVPVVEEERWLLADDALDALRILGPSPLELAAFAGGRPVGVFGEWSRAGLLPLSAWDGERMVAL